MHYFGCHVLCDAYSTYLRCSQVAQRQVAHWRRCFWIGPSSLFVLMSLSCTRYKHVSLFHYSESLHDGSFAFRWMQSVKSSHLDNRHYLRLLNSSCIITLLSFRWRAGGGLASVSPSSVCPLVGSVRELGSENIQPHCLKVTSWSLKCGIDVNKRHVTENTKVNIYHIKIMIAVAHLFLLEI